MTRLALALGGRRDTLAGLAGLGDLVLTATGSLSRNRSVGVELGHGRNLAGHSGGHAHGRRRRRHHGRHVSRWPTSTVSRCPLPSRWMPFCTAAERPRDAIRELMERRLKQE